MKKVIIVRHGKDNEDSGGLDEPLCEEGRSKVGLLSEKIAALVVGKTVAIISCTSLRGTQTAEIISRRLGIPFMANVLLWTGEGGMVWAGQLDEAFEMIWETMEEQSPQPDIFILVTHSGYAEAFPPFIGEHKLRMPLKGDSIAKGTALLIDLERKEKTYIE